MDNQPEKLGLARASRPSSPLLPASLPATKQPAFLIARVQHVCHLVVLNLWDVEDQQVRYHFVLAANFPSDPNSSCSLDSQWIFRDFLLAQISVECCGASFCLI